MSLTIRILKNTFLEGSVESVNVDFRRIRTKTVSATELIEYRELFAGIVTDNLGKMPYMLSDVLNREDGTTHFLDRLLKYLECIEIINHTDKDIIITNLDSCGFRSIKQHCHGNGLQVMFGKLGTTRYFAKKYVMSILRLVRAFLYDHIMMLYARFHLSGKIGENIRKVFISYFDYRSITEGVFTDPFFQPLQEFLKKERINFAVVNILVYGNSLKKGFEYINKIKRLKDKNITTLYNFSPLYGVILSFINMWRFRLRLKQDVYYNNHNITFFVNESLREEFLSGSLYYNLMRLYLKKLYKFKSIDSVYYPFENFIWEKLLCIEKTNIGSKVKLIAFLHSSFSFKLQQIFPSTHEKSLKIFPNKILTLGDIPKEVLTSNGAYPEGLIDTGCALRHADILAALFSNHYKEYKRNNLIAFAFSFDVVKYDYIIKKLASIFGNKDFRIILKLHPLFKDFSLKNMNLPENIINGKNMPWEEVMEKIDLLLYEGNSVCLDALAYNVPAVYFPFTGDIYNTDQLYDYKWHIDAGYDESTYYKKIEDIVTLNLKNVEDFFNYNRNYLKRCYSPITGEALQKYLD